jgi:S-adenosylmethionine:tRNA ribosyltransferase-isomerase
MKTALFDYHLPTGMIAQEPLPERSGSRLLVLDRETGAIGHRRFSDLPQYLRKGDVLVLNTTRVIPARLLGNRPTGGFVEALVLRIEPDGTCRALLRHGRKVKTGETLRFEDGRIRLKLVGRCGDKGEEFVLENVSDRPLGELLDEAGRTPLPPYIEREARPSDRETYQTVYATEPGAVAAPTAGLHFTPDVLTEIEAQGVELCRIVLHVGYGTFKPVKAENVDEHRMHSERFHVPAEAAAQLAAARRKGRRIVAVGTTSCRVLETIGPETNGSDEYPLGHKSNPYESCVETDTFIYPGFKFTLTGALLTNFHLPRSTLLMLVSAFGGREKVLAAYEEAIKEKYRFYSYGDAMLIK